MIDEDLLEAATEALEAAADLLRLVGPAMEVADALKDFSLSGGGVALVPYDLAGQRRPTGPLGTRDAIAAAGIAVVAQDTGRCLLIQRSFADPNDTARGTWEFPGGKCEGGESAFVCAHREWEEEMGQKLPPGAIAGQWTAGIYRCYIWLIQREDQILSNPDAENRTVLNPDDPDHDDIEVHAWWDAADLEHMPALRDELRAGGDFSLLRSFRKARNALKELGQLANFLAHHKKSITRFVPNALPEAEYQRIVKALAKEPAGQVLAASRQRLLTKLGPPASATRRAREREKALRDVLATTASRLGALAKTVHDSHIGFVDAATAVLRNAYAAAYVRGRQAAVAKKQGDYEESDWDSIPDDAQAELEAKLEKQHGWLQGLVQDMVEGLAINALMNRFDDYAESTISVYEAGYQDGAVEALTPDGESGGIMATWVATADDPCPLCLEKNGQSWPEDEAPLPGDGDFGEICEGAYHCRCVLEYSWASDNQQQAA